VVWPRLYGHACKLLAAATWPHASLVWVSGDRGGTGSVSAPQQAASTSAASSRNGQGNGHSGAGGGGGIGSGEWRGASDAGPNTCTAAAAAALAPPPPPPHPRVVILLCRGAPPVYCLLVFLRLHPCALVCVLGRSRGELRAKRCNTAECVFCLRQCLLERLHT
jgi:hypothetical protein